VFVDHIAFSLEDVERSALVAIEVNGVDLQRLLAAAEGGAALAGYEAGEGYTLGLDLDDLQRPEYGFPFERGNDPLPVRSHWLGRPLARFDESGRTAVLTCNCGVFGCGGFTATIAATDEAVTWSEFHHANWGPTVSLGPFEFDRDQYEKALVPLLA
jgi:hypothetical protein